jgi:hypothetical protein
LQTPKKHIFSRNVWIIFDEITFTLRKRTLHIKTVYKRYSIPIYSEVRFRAISTLQSRALNLEVNKDLSMLHKSLSQNPVLDWLLYLFDFLQELY